MNHKAILDYVKTHSPKKFAKLIKQRSQVALDIIQKLKDMTPKERRKYQYPNTLLAKKSFTGQVVKLGCPHCHSCYGCKWTEASNIITIKPLGIRPKKDVCTTIKFNGISWDNVFRFVRLTPKNIEINFYDAETNKDNFKLPIYQKAVTFLQEHINWANEKDWEKEYKP